MPRPSKPTSLGPYILLDTIGHGSFGKVKRAIHRDSRRVFAIKIMEKESILQCDVSTQVRKETLIMTTLDHPNVVKMYQAMTTMSKVVIVMELVTGGELYQEILRQKRLTEDAARHYYRQLIEGLHHCHSHGVYHRDLKPENLLLDQNGCLKISDFGLSTLQLKHEDRCHTQCGTPNYVAPEVISRSIQGYDGAKVDVWSSGIVLYVLVAGELPFDDNDPTELFRKIVAGVFELPHWFSEPLRDLIPHLLDLEPDSRYGLDQIRSHPWYTQETPPAPPPPPTPAALPVTTSTIAAAAETSASCASVAVSVARERGEEDALFPGMNFINPTFKPTDTPGNVHPDVALSIGQPSDAPASVAPALSPPMDAGARLPVVGGIPDTVLRSGAVPPLPPATARRPRSKGNSYLSRFQSAEHLSDAGMDAASPGVAVDAMHSDGEASMADEEVQWYAPPTSLPPPPRLVTGAAAVHHAPMAVRAAAPQHVSATAPPVATPPRSMRQDNIDRVAAELMAANDTAPLNEAPSALNVERMRRYLIQQQEQVLQQHHGTRDVDRSAPVGAPPALSEEGIRQLAVAREAAAVAVAASVVPSPGPPAQNPTLSAGVGAVAVEAPSVPVVLPPLGRVAADPVVGVPLGPLGVEDPFPAAAPDVRRVEKLDDVASSCANQFDDAPADVSGDLVDLGGPGDSLPLASLLPPPSALPAQPVLVPTLPPAAVAAAVAAATVTPLPVPTAAGVAPVDPDLSAVVPEATATLVPAAPVAVPAALTAEPMFSPLVDLTAAVSCNLCVGCVQGGACEAPVDVNADGFNRAVDGLWQKMVDACAADPVDGAAEAPRSEGGAVPKHAPLIIEQLQTSHAPDRSVSVPVSPMPVGHYHGSQGHVSGHNADAAADRRGTYSRRERGSASGSTRSRRSNVANGESDKHRSSPRQDKSTASSSRRRSRTSFDSKHGPPSRSTPVAGVHAAEGDYARGPPAAPTLTHRHSPDVGLHRSSASFEERRASPSGAVARSPPSSSTGRVAGGGVHKHDGDGLGRSDSSGSIELNKHAEPDAGGGVVRPSSAGSHSSSRARRLQSGDSSVGGLRGASSPMTSGGNVESQLLITRNHHLLMHIGRPWRAVGRGRPDKRSDDVGVSPGPPKPLFPPALVDDGELVVIAGDEPCLTPASPDAMASIGSAVGSDGHPSRHQLGRTGGGSASDEDGVHPAAPTTSSRGQRSGAGRSDHADPSSRSLLRSESSSRDRQPRNSRSRGHSPAAPVRHNRHRSPQERSAHRGGSQRSSQREGYPSSRSNCHERRAPEYRTRSSRGDSASRTSARPESRRSSRRGSPARVSDREGPLRSSRRRSPAGSSRHESTRPGGSRRSSRRESPESTPRRDRSTSRSRHGSPQRGSRRGSPHRVVYRESSRRGSRGHGTSRSSRHGSPALHHRREHRGSRTSNSSRRRHDSHSSSSRRRERDDRDYEVLEAEPVAVHHTSTAGRPVSIAPALALVSSRRDEESSESSSRSPRSRPEARHRSPGGRDDPSDKAARDWVARSAPSRGPSGAVEGPVGDSSTPPGGSMEGSTVTSLTGSSSAAVVEVARLGGLKGLSSRLLAKAPLQRGSGRGRRFTEFNSLLPPRATMEKLVLVLRGTTGVQSAEAVEMSSDYFRVDVRSLVAATDRPGADLLRVTVHVFRREPAGLTVASFRRNKGRQDGDDFKGWYTDAFNSFCNFDDTERAASSKPVAVHGTTRTGGVA